MALPWHKLNHKRQDYYIILATILIAAVAVGIGYLIINA